MTDRPAPTNGENADRTDPDSALSADVVASLERLWAWFEPSAYGLLPDLAADAVLVRADDDGRRVIPRLAELLATSSVPLAQVPEAVGRLRQSAESSVDDYRDITAFYDAWWIQSLRAPLDHRGGYSTDQVLSFLARTGVPMSRWQRLWLPELDGPGSPHLAAVTLEGLSGPHWEGLDDEAGQILAWARSETVLNGITLIGAIHLEPGTFGLLLDRLV